LLVLHWNHKLIAFVFQSWNPVRSVLLGHHKSPPSCFSYRNGLLALGYPPVQEHTPLGSIERYALVRSKVLIQKAKKAAIRDAGEVNSVIIHKSTHMVGWIGGQNVCQSKLLIWYTCLMFGPQLLHSMGKQG
jgi:hypothetical protein